MKTDAAAIRHVLSRFPGIRVAVLFGSLASGRAGPESDLDLGVALDTPLDRETRMALIGALAEVTGRPVDLIDLRTAGEPLLGRILTQGRRLISDPEAYAALIRRHLFEEADFMPYRRRILAERRKAWIGN